MMKNILLFFATLIFASCEIRYTNAEVKEMVVGDTAFCQAYSEPMLALITVNDTVKHIICYKRAWNIADLRFGQDECESYEDFRIVSMLNGD